MMAPATSCFPQCRWLACRRCGVLLRIRLCPARRVLALPFERRAALAAGPSRAIRPSNCSLPIPVRRVSSRFPPSALRSQNPHMHLFEALLVAAEALMSRAGRGAPIGSISCFASVFWSPPCCGVLR
ncbi:hypothetical protein H2136_18470 [Aeromonas hydrophila]|uniref:Uncharacterized protein n=1 Tax=Aeromonas hydrophila TaxID=644 RepID=A0A926FM88_AERHY|nr:hypothetical protein [Aeromonas hydrophila]